MPWTGGHSPLGGLLEAPAQTSRGGLRGTSQRAEHLRCCLILRSGTFWGLGGIVTPNLTILLRSQVACGKVLASLGSAGPKPPCPHATPRVFALKGSTQSLQPPACQTGKTLEWPEPPTHPPRGWPDRRVRHAPGSGGCPGPRPCILPRGSQHQPIWVRACAPHSPWSPWTTHSQSLGPQPAGPGPIVKAAICPPS